MFCKYPNDHEHAEQLRPLMFKRVGDGWEPIVIDQRFMYSGHFHPPGEADLTRDWLHVDLILNRLDPQIMRPYVLTAEDIESKICHGGWNL